MQIADAQRQQVPLSATSLYFLAKGNRGPSKLAASQKILNLHTSQKHLSSNLHQSAYRRPAKSNEAGIQRYWSVHEYATMSETAAYCFRVVKAPP